MCCWGWEWCQLWDQEGGEGGKQHGRKVFFPLGDAQMGQLERLLQTIFTPDGHEEQGASRAGDIHGLERCGTGGPRHLLVALSFLKVQRQLKRSSGALQVGGRDAVPCFTRFLEGLWAWRVCFLPRTVLRGEIKCLLQIAEMEFGSHWQQIISTVGRGPSSLPPSTPVLTQSPCSKVLPPLPGPL